ncbi:sterol desaturase family protein [Spirulina sp. CS-785/01]|uniref:sterol desaturase family protein n=1 Tax=Spirulina sp. CS-785/01 TaxID=3021716 RepID=UPI00232D4361|nr:sterol desaturase family protein [Spirulina sp. CS-785/01]MDB9313100.1 sterol desaturase family protein [Spirulina sp. CS-785/01]
MFPTVFAGFLLLLLILVPLERKFARFPQKVFRFGWLTDLIYFFTGSAIGRGFTGLIYIAFFSIFVNPLPWQSTIQNQPLLCQFVETVLIAETGYYFAHRLLHTVPMLWQFHAIHHSNESLDWLATVRVHPFDQCFTKFWQFTPLLMLGFSEANLAIYALFSSIIAFFIHSNLNFNFGLLNWFITTPQLHQWHHVNNPQIYNKNLAAQCPLLDLIFGTYYLPSSPPPHHLGVAESIPVNYLQQLCYPLQKIYETSSEMSH